MTTDTPSTDAALVDHMPSCSEWSQHYLDLSTFARQIERELAASKAEVERLRKEIALREDLDAVAQEVWDELKAENAKLRELVEQAADWLDYMGRSQSSATLREALNP